jgi:ferritin
MAVYNPSTIKVLDFIRERFLNMKSELKVELNSIHRQLKAFEGLGDEFKPIVQEYQNIAEQIQVITDDLTRMNE